MFHLLHLRQIHLPANWAQLVQTFLQIVGFVAVVYQLWLLTEQFKNLQISLGSATHSNIYTHYKDTVRWFLDKPHLYPYFRENMRLKDHSWPASDLALRSAEVLTLCELTTTLFEHAILEKKNMPPPTWESCWLPYIRESYNLSYELRVFFRKNRGFYVLEFQELIECQILTEIEARENAARK